MIGFHTVNKLTADLRRYQSVHVIDLLCPAKRSEAGTGQPDIKPLMMFFLSGFFILARFLPGFWGILRNIDTQR